MAENSDMVFGVKTTLNIDEFFGREITVRIIQAARNNKTVRLSREEVKKLAETLSPGDS